VLFIKDSLSFSNLISNKNLIIASSDFAFIIQLRVSINIVFFTLLNKIFYNLVNRNIKKLDIASTSFRDNRNYSIKLFKLIY
jgi:hypothetical protein